MIINRNHKTAMIGKYDETNKSKEMSTTTSSSSSTDCTHGNSATHRAVPRRGQYMDSYYTNLSGLRETSNLLKKKLNIFAVRTGTSSHHHCYAGRTSNHQCAI